jgi:RHS repeat-associated protein
VSDAPARQSRTDYNAGARPVAGSEAARTIANVPGVAVHEVQYLHPDHLGSIGQITSQTGAWVQDVYYYPYGGIRWSRDGGTTPSPASATRRTYTGQYDIGFWAGAIQHYNARQYDYGLGRFLQPDGIVPNPGEPATLNRFAYTGNNPINASDPSGHVCYPNGVCVPDTPGEWATLVAAGTALAAAAPEIALFGVIVSVMVVGLIAVGEATSEDPGYQLPPQSGPMTTTYPLPGSNTIGAGSTSFPVPINIPAPVTTGGVPLGQGAESGTTTFPVPRVAEPGSNMILTGQFAENNIRTTDHFWDRVLDAGITEDDAWDVYQNGQMWRDSDGRQIRWDPKRGIGVVVDLLDGGAVNVLDQPNRPRGWTRGWGIDHDYLEP